MADIYIFKQFFESEEFVYGIKKLIDSDSGETAFSTIYGGETVKQLAHCFYELTNGNGIVKWAVYPLSTERILPLDNKEVEEFKNELEKLINESKV